MHHESENLTSDIPFGTYFSAYGRQHPNLLHKDGFPSRDDIGSAYATCLALLRMSTNSTIKKPEFPTLLGLDQAVEDWLNALTSKIGDALSKIQSPHFGGSFSLSALIDWIESVLDAAAEVLAAVLDALQSLCRAATAVVDDIIKLAFYFIKLPLWAAFTALHRLLEFRAYAQPLPGTIQEHSELWSNEPNRARAGAYPLMEERAADGLQAVPTIGLTSIAQDQLFTSLDPMDDPAANPDKHLEFALVGSIGQDFPVGWGDVASPATPQSLLFQPRGQHDMFGPDGPQLGSTEGPVSMRDYGGIVPNCRYALEAVVAQAATRSPKSVVPDTLKLYDYNLDGDRGLGWLSWEVTETSEPLRPGADQDTHITLVPWGPDR